MSRQCKNCNSANNPDDAHFCGACGKPFNSYTTWRVVDMRGRSLVYNDELNRLRELERKRNRSLGRRISDGWEKIREDWFDGDSIGEILLTIGGLILGAGFIIFCIYSLVSGFLSDCSGNSAATQEVTYQAYKVDGKWGIGTSAENLVIPAQYDTLATFYGNSAKWWLKKNGKYGLAYTEPGKVNATECIYDNFSGNVTSTWASMKDANGKFHNKLLSNDLRILREDVPYAYVGSWNYAWIAPDEADYAAKKFILVGPEGKSRFSANGAWGFTAPDAEGMAFYKNPAGNWAAVDTSGVQRFVIEGTKAYPFTMGVAPILRGTGTKSRLGFVDRDGKRIIPFDYHVTGAESKQITFGSDSLLIWDVTKNGVKGKLHRNGTFIKK